MTGDASGFVDAPTGLRTLDVHTHLLNPKVRFDRLFDRIALGFFAASLGADRRQLKASPFDGYVSALLGSLGRSRHVARACLFGVDGRHDRRGGLVHRDPTVCADTESVLALSELHPDLLIPFLSVNPLRADALDRLDEYHQRGCRGAKFLQNYWGLDTGEERFIPYYERLARHRMPLIIHIGSEFTIESFRAFQGLDMLRLPLQCGVTVIAAHMGLGEPLRDWRWWRNFSTRPEHLGGQYHRLLEMLEQHANLYADVSAILAPFRARALRHLSGVRQVRHKLLFGTDYPVPFSVRFGSLDLPRSLRQRLHRIANPFDRYLLTLLQYFPADHPLYRNYLQLGIDPDADAEAGPAVS